MYRRLMKSWKKTWKGGQSKARRWRFFGKKKGEKTTRFPEKDRGGPESPFRDVRETGMNA